SLAIYFVCAGAIIFFSKNVCMRWSNFLIQRATSYALEQLSDSASNFVCAGATFVDFVIFRRCECLFFKKCRTYVAEIAIIYLSSSSDFLISLTFSDDKFVNWITYSSGNTCFMSLTLK